MKQHQHCSPNWLALTEATGRRVITLPDGTTIDAVALTFVRWLAPDPGGLSFPFHPGRPGSVVIGFGGGDMHGGMTMTVVVVTEEDAAEVFKVATAAHRAAKSDSLEVLR